MKQKIGAPLKNRWRNKGNLTRSAVCHIIMVYGASPRNMTKGANKMYQLFYESREDVLLSELIDGNSWDMEMQHYHNSYEIYLLLKGDRTMIIGDKTYNMHEGDLLIIPPHVIHLAKKCTTDTITRVLLNVPEGTFDRMLTYDEKTYLLSGLDSGLLTHVYNKKYMNRFLDMFYDAKKLHESSEKLSDKRSMGYIVEMIMLIKKIIADSDTVTTIPMPKARMDILKAIEFIHKHFTEYDFDMGTVLDFSHMSKSRFCELFRHMTSMTFLQYLNLVKTQTAIKLLQNTDKPISQIAMESGFSSVQHMTRIFNKTYNMPPTKYKKQIV